MKVRIEFEKNTYLNDVQEIPRAFFPYLENDETSENYLSWTGTREENRFVFSVDSDILGNEKYTLCLTGTTETERKKESKYFAKNKLYTFLSEKLGKVLPYGSLTGVRPARMYTEIAKTESNPRKILEDVYHVSPSKARLVEDCALFQEPFINRDKKNVAIYVNIPFCPTRCSYCSFISTEVFRVWKEIPRFVDCVRKNLDVAFGIIDKNGYKIRSVYVGGGTPTAVGDYLDGILEPLVGVCDEFTVECGRPDTLTEETVATLKKNKVTRLSINPQTFHQRTLDLIGRKHSVEDIYRAFDLVKGQGMDINCDLIAALPGESEEDFRFSMDRVTELRPENITVHSLSIKRGSELNRIGTVKNAEGSAPAMTEYAYRVLKEAGYSPYYMYRQKNTADNLENTGFCRDRRVCLYNVDTMEESCTVLPAGAGAVGKILCDGGKIERFAHPKGFREYCERIEETNAKMHAFFVNGLEG